MGKYLAFIVSLLFTLPVLAATPIILDTDMGSDDWMAALYLLHDPAVNVKAISIVATGEAHCLPAVRTAGSLLLMSQVPTLPVACGAPHPLQGNKHFPNWFRSLIDQRFGIPLPVNKQLNQQANAVDMMHSILANSPEKITILAIGPLTNIAQLFAKYPDVKSKIQRLVILGGTVNVPGNLPSLDPKQKNTAAEWNFYVDAYAAKQVLFSGVPITLVPLDACNQVLLDNQFYQRFSQQARTPAAKFIAAMLQKNLSYIQQKEYYFWDPLAAVVTAQAGFYQLQAARLDINLKPGIDYAKVEVTQQGAPVEWVDTVNAVIFKQLFQHYLHASSKTH